MKLRNDKEINALFASAHSPTEPTEVSGCARYSSTDCTDTHRLGEPTKLFSHRTHRSFWRRRKICEFCEFCGKIV